MKVFNHPNINSGWKCPICKESTDKPVALIGVEGTEKDGKMETEQFHLDCIELSYYKDFDTLKSPTIKRDECYLWQKCFIYETEGVMK